MNECFDALQALNENILFAKLKVMRIVDKQLFYEIVFANRDMIFDLLHRIY